MPEDKARSPRAFTEVAIELGLCDERKIRDAVLVKQKLAEMGVHRSLEDILVERGYITEEGIKKIEQLLRGDNRLAGFELIERVGSGAMGAVFRARQVSLDRIVALKVLPRHLAEDPSFVNRFLREARNVAKLNHPNIIQGIDVGEDRGYYYFAMEYIDGPNVRSIIEEKGPLPEKEALRILHDAAKGLEHAWKNNILHRDIKPANIMLTSQGAVKLCDLGLATARGPEADASGSSVGKAVGTPYYISPEQATGDKDVDIRSDIYSLGSTLYHMLSGKPPFEGNPAAVVLAKHLKDKVEPISSVRPDISRNVLLFLAKLLAKDRNHRHQTPTEVIEDIEDLQSAKPPRHSLNFRQESTLPLPGVAAPSRQTGRHATVGVRRVKVRTARKSNIAALMIIVFLFMALTAIVVWHVSRGGIGIPGIIPPARGADKERFPFSAAPSEITPPAVETPAKPGTGREPVKPPDAPGAVDPKKVIAAILSDLRKGRIGPEEAQVRLDAFNAEHPGHAFGSEAEKIQSEIKQRVAEKQAALARAVGDITRLAAAGDMPQAFTALDALLQSGYATFETEPARLAVLAACLKSLDAVDARVKAAVNASDPVSAASAVDEWCRNNEVAVNRFSEVAGRVDTMKQAIAALEVKLAEAKRRELARLAAAIHDASAVLRNGRVPRPEDLPGDLAEAHLKALIRESGRVMALLDSVARKVADLETVTLTYRGASVTGKASYAAPGKVKVRTRLGLELGIPILDVPSDQVVLWCGLKLPDLLVARARFIVFAGVEGIPEPPKGTVDNDDLVLLIDALKAAKEAEAIRNIGEKLQSMNPDTADLAGLVSMLGSLRQLKSAADPGPDILLLDGRIRSALTKRLGSFLGAKGRESASGLSVVYDTTDPLGLGDWLGIDGGWTWSAPGLVAAGGKMTHLLSWTHPLRLSFFVERTDGWLIVGVGGLEVNIDAVITRVAAGSTALAEAPSPGKGRFAVNITIDGRTGRLDAGPAVKLAWKDAPALDIGAPIYFKGAGFSLWGLTIEGTPIPDSNFPVLKQLSEARGRIEAKQKASWPILPGLPGWIVERGAWKLGDTGYLEATGLGPGAIRAAARLTQDTAVNVIYRQRAAASAVAKAGFISIIETGNRGILAGARGLMGRWVIEGGQQTFQAPAGVFADEQDYPFRVEVRATGMRLVAGAQVVTASGTYLPTRVFSCGLSKADAPCAFKDLSFEPLGPQQPAPPDQP